MVVKIEVMQIKEREASSTHFNLRTDKGDLKGFQQLRNIIFTSICHTVTPAN